MMIKSLLYIFLGLYFILAPFIYKVIIIKLPKNITDIHIIFIYLSLFIYLYLIFKLMQNYVLRKESSISKYLKVKLILPLQEIYFNSMIYIDDYVKHELLGPKYIGKNLLIITEKILNKKLTDSNSIIIFILLDILPKIIILFVLFVDVVINKRFNYIYIFGFITLIPLLFRYLVFTFKSFASANIEIVLLNYLIFYDENFNVLCLEKVLENFLTNRFNNYPIDQYIKSITLKESLQEHEDFDNILDFYLNQFYVFSNLYNYMNFFEEIKKQTYYKIFLLILYLSYFFIWLYILYYNLIF